MSHVRRKPSRHPGRVQRKKSNKREWMSFWLILIFAVSIVAGILMVVFSAP